ncbi:hypothetical protein [Prosthecobacter sp.]|uniref:hypothetical protein n=1 Tax=Prosthecobacter sp. TaxID=1965333 RepID=UPI003783F7F2
MKPHTTLLILLVGFVFHLTALHAEEVPTMTMSFLGKYQAVTMTAVSLDSASWFVPNEDGKYEAGFDHADELIAHYRTKPAERISDGIFVVSYTHSIPFTEEEKKRMSPHLLKLSQHKPWRDAENKLVDELVAAANKEGIPVWINTSLNMAGTYQNKLLTDPKLTLRK